MEEDGAFHSACISITRDHTPLNYFRAEFCLFFMHWYFALRITQYCSNQVVTSLHWNKYHGCKNTLDVKQSLPLELIFYSFRNICKPYNNDLRTCLKLRPCCIAWAVARLVWQGQGLKFSQKHLTFAYQVDSNALALSLWECEEYRPQVPTMW